MGPSDRVLHYTGLGHQEERCRLQNNLDSCSIKDNGQAHLAPHFISPIYPRNKSGLVPLLEKKTAFLVKKVPIYREPYLNTNRCEKFLGRRLPTPILILVIIIFVVKPQTFP